MHYSATFSAIAVTAAQDVFEIVAGASTRVRFDGLILGQYSDAGDAADELLSVQLIRGYTTSGSGGAAVTPTNLFAPSDATAVSTVERNNTTVAQDGTGAILLADVWHVLDRYSVMSDEDLPEHIILEPSQRLVVRITAPADALTCNGTLFFSEIGKSPVS